MISHVDPEREVRKWKISSATTSVIVGSFSGLLVGAFIVESLTLSVGVGIAAFAVRVLLLRRHQISRWHQIEQRLPTLFPSEPAP